MDADFLSHYAAESRGIVVFNNHKALVWGSPDGTAVEAWVRSYDKELTPEIRKVCAENGGVFHCVAYTVKTGYVSYETEH